MASTNGGSTKWGSYNKAVKAGIISKAKGRTGKKWSEQPKSVEGVPF